MYDRKLNLNEIKEVEKYFNTVYGIASPNLIATDESLYGNTCRSYSHYQQWYHLSAKGSNYIDDPSLGQASRNSENSQKP